MTAGLDGRGIIPRPPFPLKAFKNFNCGKNFNMVMLNLIIISQKNVVLLLQCNVKCKRHYVKNGIVHVNAKFDIRIFEN
jgi:hypothetical protein